MIISIITESQTEFGESRFSKERLDFTKAVVKERQSSARVED